MESEVMGLSCEGVGRKSVGCTIAVLKLGRSTLPPPLQSENQLADAHICGVAVRYILC
jgi:hypothetical protein